jgi:hypothetical protein
MSYDVLEGTIMHDWDRVREAHATTEHFEGYRVLKTEFAGHPFKVLDIGYQENDPFAGHNASTFFDHEPPFLEHWKKIKPGDVVVDIGASLGSYSIPALAMGARVIAFEPDDTIRSILRLNAEVNGDTWYHRFTVFGYILGNDLPYPVGLRPYAELSKLDISGSTMPLDEMCITKCDWIKIDCEGLESEVLDGASNTIQKHTPTLIIEDHDSIDPGNPVSDYPASINSSKYIQWTLKAFGYDVSTMTHGDARRYIVARHPSIKDSK